MKTIATIAACLMLSACAGVPTIVDHGNIKEIRFEGFVDAPATEANGHVMQYLAMQQCPGGYSIVSQSQKVSFPRNIVWRIKCQ